MSDPANTPDNTGGTARAWMGGIVVVAGLGAIVLSVKIITSKYSAGNTDAVVAILTPVVAAIAAVVGLYFGLSASGSARGVTAQSQASTADALTNVTKAHARTAQTLDAMVSKLGPPLR